MLLGNDEGGKAKRDKRENWDHNSLTGRQCLPPKGYSLTRKDRPILDCPFSAPPRYSWPGYAHGYSQTDVLHFCFLFHRFEAGGRVDCISWAYPYTVPLNKGRKGCSYFSFYSGQMGTKGNSTAFSRLGYSAYTPGLAAQWLKFRVSHVILLVG